MDTSNQTIKNKTGRKKLYSTKEEKYEAIKNNSLNYYYRKKAKQNQVLKETLTNEEKELLELIKKMNINNNVLKSL